MHLFAQQTGYPKTTRAMPGSSPNRQLDAGNDT